MRIAITRLREKGGQDAALCRRYGHECFTVSPLRAIVYQDRIREFTEEANRGGFDCIFFTSALPAQIIGPLLTRWPRVVAIGPQTARTLGNFGIAAETLPAYYSREFASYLGDWLRGRHVGIPRADVPNPALLDAISAQGGVPHEIRVYGLEPTDTPLPLEDADAIIFTSAGSFEQAVWEERDGLLLIAIGTVTAAAMERRGHAPDVTGDGSLEGTLAAIGNYMGKKAGVR
jgi:uroporphyrinogen-III synthase